MRKISQYKSVPLTNSGYALYTAIILTGLLILVAYVTANLSIKQLELSSTAADSHIAFYNTDSGLECALYWDLQNGATSAFDANTAGSITCNGQTITTGSQTVQTTPTEQSLIGGGGLDVPSIFQLNLTQGCVIVEVTKCLAGSAIPACVGKAGTTLIESRGYNTCSGSNRLERGIETQY